MVDSSMPDQMQNIRQALDNPRDVDMCLKGLNQLRKALRTGQGLAMLAAWTTQNPHLDELQLIWDAQLTTQNYHVVVTLLLTLTDVLNAITEAANRPAPAPEAASLRPVAAALAHAVLSRRMKNLYFNLSSEVRGKATASLLLLAAVASTGLPQARELVRLFDFSLSALPSLAKLPRGRKGEADAETAARFAAEWRSDDALKRPTRAAFVHLTLCLLRASDALLLAEVLTVRPLVGGLLHQLASDPPEVQMEVLQVLHKRVLTGRPAPPSAVQSAILSDAALSQLSAIAALDQTQLGASEDSEDEAGDASGEDSKPQRPASDGAGLTPAEHREQAARLKAAHLAGAILHAICTQPAHGLASTVASCSQFSLADAAAALSPAQRRLLRWLQRLRPSESTQHGELLEACTAHDPALAVALLLSLPYNLEPTATGAWLAHAGTVCGLLQRLAEVPPGLSSMAQRGWAPPAVDGKMLQAVLRCVLPVSLPRAALSRGVQHSNALVRHTTLCLLCSALCALESVLRDIAAAATHGAQGSSSAGGSAAWHAWLALAGEMQQGARSRLPDPQAVLAQLSALSKGSALGEANEALLSAALRTLCAWRRCLPAALAEANVDAEKLLPHDLLRLRPLHQLQFMQLLNAAHAVALPGSVHGALSDSQTTLPSLLPVLQLLVGATQGEVKAAAWRWLHLRLLASGIFEGNGDECVVWLDLLPGHIATVNGAEGEGITSEGALCSFLAGAVSQVLRRPDELFEALQQALDQVESAELAGREGDSQQAQQQPAFSLLALCALRQALRVLPSAKMSGQDKATIARYVASVLTQLGQQQEDTAQLAAVLLRVVSTEAERLAQPKAAGDSEAPPPSSGKKRKDKRAGPAAMDVCIAAAPEEAGAPLAALAEWLQQHAAGGGEKAKRRKKEKGADTVGNSALPAELQPTASESSHFEVLPACHLAAVCFTASSEVRGKAGAALQQRLTAAPARCGAATRQGLHLLQQALAAGHSTAPAFAILRAAAAAAGAAALQGEPSHEMLHCLQLLSSSQVLLQTLAGSGSNNADAALHATNFLHWLLHLDDSSAETRIVTACTPLLCSVIAGAGEAVQRGDTASMDAAVQRLVQVLPLITAHVNTAAHVVEAAWRHLHQLASSAETEAVAGSATRLARGICSASQGLLAKGAIASDALLQTALQGLVQGRASPASAVQDALRDAQYEVLACALRCSSHQAAALAALALHKADLGALVQELLLSPSPQHSHAAEALIEASPAAQAAFQAALTRAMRAAEDATDKAARRTALALLLPPSVAYLQQQSAAQEQGDDRRAAAEQLLQPLLGFLSAKQHSGKRVSSLGAPHEAGMGAEAAQALHRCAIPCLAAALQAGASLEPDQLADALHKLLPATGWSVSAEACTIAALLPATAEKAAAAVLLLRSPLQSGAPRLAELCAAVQCFTATLAALFALPSPGEAQRRLERVLLGQLDCHIGDDVASLAAADRCTPDFARLTDTACQFGTALLRYRSGDVAAVRCLRRFAAALLPGDAEERGVDQDKERGAADASGNSSDESAPSSSAASSEDGGDHTQTQIPASVEVCNPPVAAAAGQLLHLAVCHSNFLPALRAAAASPPPLPEAAAALPRPLTSLAALAADAPGVDPSSEAATPARPQAAAAQLKKELCELLETLLDLEDRFKAPGQGSRVASGSILLETVEIDLLPLLMACYGGSLSAADRAVWSLARALNGRAWGRAPSQRGITAAGEDQNGGWDVEADVEAEGSEVEALMQGPLALTCFAWGEPAVLAAQATAAGQAPSSSSPSFSLSSTTKQQWQEALAAHLPLDPLRCALTVLHFPEWRTLTGEDTPPPSPALHAAVGGSGTGIDALAANDAVTGGDGIRRGISSPFLPPRDTVSSPEAPSSSLPPWAHCPAGYDPAFLLPFCVTALGQRLLPPRSFAQLGLLSLCLRATAAEDAALRGVAFEALGLLSQQLEEAAAAAAAADASTAAGGRRGKEGRHGSGGAAGLSGLDFKERPQLSLLLASIRNALPSPFLRLPAVHAVFLAEVALVLCHPAAAMYPWANKLLLKEAALDLRALPLFGRLVLSGSQEAPAERCWLLSLLLAGLRSSRDAALYRRQYVCELAMSLHDAAAADQASARLALRLVCRAAAVPAAARSLAERSGLVGWLATAALRAADVALAAATGTAGSAAGAAALEDARCALHALRQVTTLRSVARARGGDKDFALAARQLVAGLAALTGPANVLAPSHAATALQLWAAALRFIAPTCTAAQRTSTPDSSKVGSTSHSAVELARYTAAAVLGEVEVEVLAAAVNRLQQLAGAQPDVEGWVSQLRAA